MRSDQYSWCKKDRVNRPVQLFYHSDTNAQRRCWHRDANQLKFEVADHQVSGLGSCKEQPPAIETRIYLDEALKTFERLSSILEIKSWAVLTKTGCVQFFWVPSRELSCSFVKLNYFSSAFVNETSSNVSEKIVVRKSLAPKAEAKNAGSANNDADETPRPPISAG